MRYDLRKCVGKLVSSVLLVSATVLGMGSGLAIADEKSKLVPVLPERGSHFQTEAEIVPVEKDGIHDASNGAVKNLQAPVEAMKDFPRDSAGITDWVQAIEKGLINPRMGREGSGKEKMTVVDFDIVFDKTGSMPVVRYPHKQHTEWLTCANCHPKIFIPEKGANPVTMSAIMQGKYCGVCHGKVAFPPTMNCGRCHSEPRKTKLLR